MKKRIALVYGGRSGEHEVSRRSAASIALHLDCSRYKLFLIGITQEGQWYLQDEAELARNQSGTDSLQIIRDEEQRLSIIPGGGKNGALALTRAAAPSGFISVDVMFPALHGSFGEDGTIQGLFEMAELPYVGPEVLGSAIGMDKAIAKELWLHAGLPTIPFIALSTSDWNDQTQRLARIQKAEKDFGYPVFIKPACAGSSVGAGKAQNRAELEAQVKEAFLWDDKVLLEPFVVAQEVECSVTGNENPIAYSPGEVIPSHEFYDYEAKYIDPDGAELIIPARLDEADLRKIQAIAVEAYKTIGLRGLARVDFFVRKDNGGIYLNEVNTMPGFTSISMFPRMCEASGLSYAQLLDTLIELAEQRYDQKQKRSYNYGQATRQL
ncbi:D-alanine--D-alanine ligase family protein [Treponema sp.]